jgi:hypothetical protein
MTIGGAAVGAGRDRPLQAQDGSGRPPNPGVLVAIVGGIAAAGILLAAEPGALSLPGR